MLDRKLKVIINRLIDDINVLISNLRIEGSHFNFDEVWVAFGNQTGIALQFICVPLFDESESVHSPLTLHNSEPW